MPPGLLERLKYQHKASGDSASSPELFALSRAGSTCDSSACTICQPQHTASQTGQQGEGSPRSVGHQGDAGTHSTASCRLTKLERRHSRLDVGGTHTDLASASLESSPASSQTVQRMRGGSTSRSCELDVASGRLSADEEQTEGWLEQRAASHDDFVTTEQSELQRGYGSASSLAQGADGAVQKRQKRVINSSSGGEVLRDDMPCWVWNMEWELQPDPIEARFEEVACFERPVSSQHKRHNADILCGLEFSPDGHFLASAGVTKQIRVYPLAGVRGAEVDGEPLRAAYIHRLPAKISSIAWNPFDEGIVTVGDYDGVVAQVHIPSGHLLADLDEYMGRRVWSVAHSQHKPHLCASSSDDGTAHLWAGRGLSERAGQISVPGQAPISGVSFCTEDENALALAASDACAYVYDIRQHSTPLQVLKGHNRPVSFARFMGRNRLVTASVDSSLALWNLDQGSGHLFRRYEGHTNRKNFVGLSVCQETELMATGSECGQAMAYHRAWSRPVAAHDVCSHTARSTRGQPEKHAAVQPESSAPKANAPADQAAALPELASAVCWWPTSLGSFAGRCGGPVLAAARSDGVLSLLTLVNSH